MDQSLDTLVARIIDNGRVSPEDVLALRQSVWKDGAVGAAEAEMIFAINNAVPKTCPQWVDFFVEAISVYLVDQSAPRGYVDQDKADWFIAKIGKDGVLSMRSELLLLVAIFERAEYVADTLRDYAIAQVERIVLTGEGPTRAGAIPRAGVIEEGEVALLRRVLYAPASEGGATISRDEALALFRIKQATLGAANAPSWQTLFVQLVANHLRAPPPAAPLSPERATQLDAFMNDTMPNVGRFLSRMEATFLQPSTAMDAVGATLSDRKSREGESMSVAEASWLKAQIVADGQIDPIEKALLAFIIDEAGPLPVAIEDPVALSA